MPRKRFALSVLTPRRRREQHKRRRHNDKIHDEDVENQQASPHPMSSITLPQAFLYAPNTFNPVSHIGAMNKYELYSTELKRKTWLTRMRGGPKTQASSL